MWELGEIGAFSADSRAHTCGIWGSLLQLRVVKKPARHGTVRAYKNRLGTEICRKGNMQNLEMVAF